METKRQSIINQLDDHELNPAQLMLRNSAFIKRAHADIERMKLEEIKKAEQKEAEAIGAKVTVHGSGGSVPGADDAAIDLLIDISIDEAKKKEWVKQWAAKSTSIYLEMLLRQELPNSVGQDGKLNTTALAELLKMRYQSVYQLFKGFSPRLDTLAGIAAGLGYAVEIRFIPVEKAVEHEAYKDRLTLDGEVEL